MSIKPIRLCALSVFAIWLSCVSAAAQTVLFYRFTPVVVRNTETQPVLFEARMIGVPTSLTLTSDFNGTNVIATLVDNGTNGDRQAGDGIYSANLTAAQVVQGLTANDVFRRFIGYLIPYQGTTILARYNVFAQISTPEIPAVTLRQLAPDAQASDYIVNITLPGYYNNATSNNDYPALLRRFYTLFPDNYDQVALVSVWNYIANRFHVGTRNEVAGIGLPMFNNTATVGSTGRLLGYNVFNNTGLFDGAEVGYQHEIGHQWVQFMQNTPFATGIPHWPLSSLASGIMGFSIGGTGGEGGHFRCTLTPEAGGIRLARDAQPEVFKDFDLYLMGLLPADQIGEHIVFNNQTDPLIQQCNGLYTGAVTHVRAADLVAQLGPRLPSVTNSPKQFRVANIVVSPNGLLSPEVMAYYEFFAKRAEATRELVTHGGFLIETQKPFALSTGGRATLITNLQGIVQPTPTPTPGPLVAVTATSYAQNQLASESIAAAFGANLATETRVASTIPLPTSLAGTSLKVRDALGVERLAPLFFVSPAQVNFLVPVGMALGNATYTLTSSNGPVSAGATTIAAISPGLFTFNADGQGVPAASALRVKADGTQSYESIARYDQATARWVNVPINLGPEGEQVFLILYGSGLRGVSSLSAVTCSVGGGAAQVLYAGAQGELVGLDQVNVGLPRNLIGRSNVNLTLTIDGKTANTVQLTIQ